MAFFIMASFLMGVAPGSWWAAIWNCRVVRAVQARERPNSEESTPSLGVGVRLSARTGRWSEPCPQSSAAMECVRSSWNAKCALE